MKAFAFSPRVKLALFAVLLAIAACIPFPSVTVPQWKVQFVDRKGRPVAGLKVEQTWQNYSTENRANKESSRTDAQGYVIFPERTNRASMAARILGPVANFMSTLWEASYGPSTWITTGCDLSEDFGDDRSATPPKVVLEYWDRSKERAIFGGPPLPVECAAIEAQARDAGFARRPALTKVPCSQSSTSNVAEHDTCMGCGGCPVRTHDAPPPAYEK